MHKKFGRILQQIIVIRFFAKFYHGVYSAEVWQYKLFSHTQRGPIMLGNYVPKLQILRRSENPTNGDKSELLGGSVPGVRYNIPVIGTNDFVQDTRIKMWRNPFTLCRIFYRIHACLFLVCYKYCRRQVLEEIHNSSEAKNNGKKWKIANDKNINVWQILSTSRYKYNILTSLKAHVYAIYAFSYKDSVFGSLEKNWSSLSIEVILVLMLEQKTKTVLDSPGHDRIFNNIFVLLSVKK